MTGKVPAARTDKEAMEALLAELRRYNVVRAVAGGLCGARIALARR